ncbi:MAG: DNA replication initiation ATPase [Methylocystaceae bacterium]|nr:MAG: DNA replication initiation ATPase [Methylocystaceae bacterium]KAF0213682.1 MAG: DNA replication initiation [Methylocystaceae bacterium]TXT44212.1 MAG: DNA replication initiation ATPase [Methylocystaceae bacterium]
MKKSARTPNRDETGRVMRRLLKALAEPGARGALSPLEASTLVVLAARKGVTVARARFAAAASDAALAEGLARWEQDGGERRLSLTDAGRAYLRRLSAPDVDQAEPFRAQHASYALRQFEKGARPTLVNDAESPLAWLARRKDREGRTFLDAAQLEAGERFRRDIEQAQLLQRVTANWEASINAARQGADAGAVSEVAIDARRRLARAVDATGPELAGLLTDVCGYLKGMEIVESERGWPPRSAKVVLKIALDRLARHYGLAVEARGRDRAESLLHWGAEDYRPRV